MSWSAYDPMTLPLLRQDDLPPAKRKKHDDERHRAMQGQLSTLIQRRALVMEKSVNARHGLNGSLTQLVTDYYRHFTFGLDQALVGRPDLGRCQSHNALALLPAQARFIQFAFEPDMVIGNNVGIPALIQTWSHFMVAYANIHKVIDGITITGPEYDPTMVVAATVRARIVPQTFQFFFPFLVQKESFMRKFMSKEVVLKLKTSFTFSPNGRIKTLMLDIDYAGAFSGAGASAAEVYHLLQHSVVRQDSTLAGTSGSQSPPPAPQDAKQPIIQPSKPAPQTRVKAGPKPPRRPPNRKISNSVRGKLYRAKQQKVEDDLSATVDSLRTDVEKLDQQRSQLLQKTSLGAARNSLQDSVVEFVREYYSLFEYGMGPESGISIPPLFIGRKRALLTDAADRQAVRDRNCEAFLLKATGPDGHMAGLVTYETMLSYWRRFSASYTSFRRVAERIQVIGPEDAPVVVASGILRVRFSRDSFPYMFPKLAKNSRIVPKFMDKMVVISFVARYEFNEHGCMTHTSLEPGYVKAFTELGLNLADIAALMESSVIPMQVTLNPPLDTTAKADEDKPAKQACCSHQKLRLGFLLAEEQAEESLQDEKVVSDVNEVYIVPCA